MTPNCRKYKITVKQSLIKPTYTSKFDKQYNTKIFQDDRVYKAKITFRNDYKDLERSLKHASKMLDNYAENAAYQNQTQADFAKFRLQMLQQTAILRVSFMLYY